MNFFGQVRLFSSTLQCQTYRFSYLNKSLGSSSGSPLRCKGACFVLLSSSNRSEADIGSLSLLSLNRVFSPIWAWSLWVKQALRGFCVRFLLCCYVGTFICIYIHRSLLLTFLAQVRAQPSPQNMFKSDTSSEDFDRLLIMLFIEVNSGSQ